MTKLLKKAFEQASQLPEELQNEVALQFLEDVEGEGRWAATFASSPDPLEKLADTSLEDLRAGQTWEVVGFDEL